MPGASKCKHCGEWLSEPPGASPWKSGSRRARGVNRGLKEKEFDDFISGCYCFCNLVISGGIGVYYESWWAFGVSFLIIAIPISLWYYRE